MAIARRTLPALWMWLLASWCVLPGTVLLAAGPKAYPFKITCTTGIVADSVRRVAGNLASVEAIIAEGVDPHLYSATRNDIAKLLAADVIFYNGLMLEGKMADALVKVARKKPVFAVTELIDDTLVLEPAALQGHHDPHLWMDVALWKQCTETIATELSKFDPTNKESYRQNWLRHADELDKLHDYAAQVLGSIPERSRVLVTAHDAFNYMGRAYGIEVRGIQGISTESEAGIEDIKQLVTLLVERDIKAVFVETSVSEKNIKALIEGAAARGHEVRIGGKLFSDSMGAHDTYEGSFIGMIDHNVTTIARQLGGSAPQRGLHGKLNSPE